jgi:signal transduction histidine kinase
MHHSNELISVIGVMFEKLKELNVLLGTVAIWLFNKETMDSIFWVGNDWQQPAMVHLPYDEELMGEETNYKDSWEAWLSGESYINKEYSKEQKDRYFRYVFAHNDLVAIPPAAREMLMQAQKYIACLLVEKHSSLYFDCWHGATYDEESIQVLKRVAKVFEQAYVRFLDLQKAEALAVRAEQDLIEIKAARKNAEDTLTELRATQGQLIQAEKMASLGELTAGIAHEIQNPLNFVNNFSEVSTELVEELKMERSKANGDRDEELEGEILNDISQNLQKIAHHGKRADAIVKGMLQHSRASTNKTEPTDINALADEYLRLSYHGFRAKDKEFNADFTTDFDESIGKINVVPQDIGRVLLNLYNNAFYAVNERRKAEGLGYEPTVLVTTIKLHDHVVVRVKDNGNGIPQKVLDKIYQPFFTTKPTGQGTGLGLSLSYDIIKAHGGEMKVESKVGEGSEFVLMLPA